MRHKSNHRLPPSTEGEWWELSDDSRGGLPYYYQTKTGETVWERPSGFVIPLGIIQVSLENVQTSAMNLTCIRIQLLVADYHGRPLTGFPNEYQQALRDQ